MKKSNLMHNQLDLLVFSTILFESRTLDYYTTYGELLLPDFKDMMRDVFLSLYKVALVYDKPSFHTTNDLLFEYLLESNAFKRLRIRTSGSKSNTYIAMKFIFDLLFEKLRGTHFLEELNLKLSHLDTAESLLHDQIRYDRLYAILENDELSQCFNKEEWTSLSTIHFNPQEDNTPSKWLLEMLKFAFKKADPLDASSDQEQIEQIAQALKQQDLDDSLSSMIKELQALSDAVDSDKSGLESKDEIVDQNGTLDDDFKSRMKDDFEQRFEPIIKNIFLSEGQSESLLDRQISSLSDTESADKYQLIQGKPSKPLNPVQIKAHKVSSQFENQLRKDIQSFKVHGTPHVSKRETPLDASFSLTELEWLKQSIKQQMNTLNLDAALSEALDQVDGFNQNAEVLGIDPQSLNALSFDDVIRFNKRMIAPGFARFINKVGKTKRYAKQLQYKKRHEKSVSIDKITTSNKLDLLIDEELISLSLDIEAFENDFYDRFLKDDLLTIEMTAKKDKRKGPIILCYDGSGSMEGIKITETQSHILSIIEIAKIQKRQLILIQFASASEPLFIKPINPLNVSVKDILEILDTFICGGTDFEKPLSKAIEYIKQDQHKKSDILFITDGQCEISSKFKADFVKLKKSRQFKLFTIIMHAYTYRDYGDIGEISDEILEITDKEWHHDTHTKLFSLI